MLRTLFILLAVFSTPSHASDNRGQFGFESANLDGWSLKRLPAKEHGKVISSPVRAGKFAASIALPPGVIYKGGFKNELSDKFIPEFGQEIWYRVSHYLPEDFEVENDNACMLAQWHNNAELGLSPLLANRYERGKIKATVAFGVVHTPKNYYDVRNKILFEAPAEKNRWHDFVYRVKWSRGKIGKIQSWYDGKCMGTYVGPTGYQSDDAGPYFKTGVYCAKSPQKLLTAYVDEYRRGNSKEDVLLPGETLETSAWCNSSLGSLPDWSPPRASEEHTEALTPAER